ncbi:hypothetical protein DL769_002921 [Monosporascus sp. CRB-8-3]|nr:hypothetical protein DL769_002921 [Monosporascus sp. CRB-8-3]
MHLLPKYISNIRVLSFQYNTTLRSTTSEAKITDHARELLDRLDLDRIGGSDGPAALRPIIFVGHSLGGMLIKKAIEIAHRDWRYRQLWDASRGVMFFATPHHGMDEISWPEFASLVLRLSAPYPGIPPTKRMLEQIKLNSRTFLKITEDFGPLQESLAFVNFTEGRIIPGLKHVLVDAGRGWMDAPNKRQGMLEGDHIGICKFGRDRSDLLAFATVCDGIRYLIEQSPKAIELLELEAKKALHSLRPSGFHGYFVVKEPTEGTCDGTEVWQELQDWLSGNGAEQMFWIQVPPACGKSYLARHIITDLIPLGHQEVAHCFPSDSLSDRGNIEALLRATLHHALRLEPELVAKFLFPPYRAATQSRKVPSRPVRDEEIWTRDILSPMWPDAVADVVARRSLTMVVDGFDEMGRECQQGFMDCLARFEAKATPENAKRLRVLLLWREDSEVPDSRPVGVEKFQTYKMTREGTPPDVTRTVMATLINNPRNPVHGADEAISEKICEVVIQSSESRSPRAGLAVEEFARTGAVSDVRTTKGVLEELPRDTTGRCDRILKRMHENTSNLSLVRQVLRWAVFQKEALREAEFDIAIAVGMALDQDLGQHITSQKLEDLLACGIRTMVDTHCGQAVELRDGRLSIVHRDFKECLIARTGGVCSDLSYMDEEPSHAALAIVCIAYLTMPCFADSGAPLQAGEVDLWEAKVRKRIKDYAFVRYAALYWFKHLDAAGASWSEVNPQLDRDREMLQDSRTQYAKCWTEVWWFLTKGVTQEYPGLQGCPGIRAAQAAGPASEPTVELLQETPDTSRFEGRQSTPRQAHSEFDSLLKLKLAENESVKYRNGSIKDDLKTESRMADEKSISEDIKPEDVKIVPTSPSPQKLLKGLSIRPVQVLQSLRDKASFVFTTTLLPFV